MRNHATARGGIPPWRARLTGAPFVLTVLAALTLGGCSLFKTETPAEPAAGEPAAATPQDGDRAVAPVELITAQTPAIKAYRKTGAGHIYKVYAKRLYKGKIPPLVYAVVVVETHLDASGNVTSVSFSRTPSHAPEVPPKIAELVRQASPFPNPGRVGAHTYVETWLWDRSGQFQLDSLTLGQRSR